MSLDKKRNIYKVKEVLKTVSFTDREVLSNVLKHTGNPLENYSIETAIEAIGRTLLRSDSEDYEELLLGLCDLALSVEDE